MTNVTDGANEILSFLGHDLALTNGNSVAGVTVSITGTTATVTFPGAADAAALQALIDGLAYRNASENPTAADRVITITRLVDSGGTAGGGDDTAALDIVSTVHVARPMTRRSSAATRPATSPRPAASTTARRPRPATSIPPTSTTPNDAWQAVAAGAATTNGFGTFALTADGQWTYTLDNTNAAVQALNAASAPLTDTFTVLTQDGTAQLVTVTITRRERRRIDHRHAAGDVTEAGSINNGTPTATGNLDSTDVDNPNDAWQAVAAGAATTTASAPMR